MLINFCHSSLGSVMLYKLNDITSKGDQLFIMFFSARLLTLIMFDHQNVEEFKCEVCGKITKSKGGLLT